LIRLQALGYWTERYMNYTWRIHDYGISFRPTFQPCHSKFTSQQRIRAHFIAFGSSHIYSPCTPYLWPYYVILTYLPILFRRRSTIAIQVLFHAFEQADRKWEREQFVFSIIYRCALCMRAIYGPCIKNQKY